MDDSASTIHSRYQRVPTRSSVTPKTAPPGLVQLGPLGAQPLVSIIVPSFNQGRYIAATLESILQQNYRPIEVLVIDGASTDETVSILKSYEGVEELSWVSEPDRGVVEAVNKGLALAKGDILAIQSSDDCYLPGALESVIKGFRGNLDVGLIYGDTVKTDAMGREISRYCIGSFTLENLFLLKTWIPQPSAFFRREMLDRCGGWDEGIPYAPDTDLWIRIAFRTQVLKLNTFLSQRRIHDAQRDKQARLIVRDYARMVDQSADIAAAPPHLRRAARAGVHLMRVRYNATKSDWYAAWQLLLAGCWFPGCIEFAAIGHHLVLPLRRVLSWLKQRILLLPGRTS